MNHKKKPSAEEIAEMADRNEDVTQYMTQPVKGFSRKGIAKTRDGEYEVPDYVQDIISVFYYVRTLDFSDMKIDERIHLQNFYKDKVHDLDVKYLGKETIEVPSGKFDCIIVEPLMKEGGLFKHDGNIIIWLTDDNLKMPVKVRTKIVVGHVEAMLSKYEGLAGQLTSKR